MVITEFVSRYSAISILFDISSYSVIKAFVDCWLNIHKSPKYCLSDNGRQFTSQAFKQMLKQFKIQQILTSPNNPTGNSVVERINKEISIALRIARNKSLNEVQQIICIRLNLTNNRVIAHSTYILFYGLNLNVQKGKNILYDINEIKERIEKHFNLNMSKSNKKRTDVNYKIGDMVLKKNFDPDKIASRYRGPFRIIGVSSTKKRCNYRRRIKSK
ncbi:Pro-Pol polyprotein [Dictyocoela muelleri]|nr:Pro-Pol polyprotein [Dictyocoela muelleri]